MYIANAKCKDGSASVSGFGMVSVNVVDASVACNQMNEWSI